MLSKAAEELFVRLVFSVAVPTGFVVTALYIFNSLGDVQYLPASAMAFGTGFFLIYLLFKYWIYPDVKKGSAWQQFKRFLVVLIISICINTEIVYLLVTYMNVPLFTAQIVAAVVVAYESYYAYISLLTRNDHMRLVAIRRTKTTEDTIEYYNEDGERIE